MSWLIFSGEMMRALREDRKNVTRRLIKWPGEQELGCLLYRLPSGELWPYDCRNGNEIPLKCPQGVPGDHLYCRENWAVVGCYDNRKPSDLLHLSPRNIWYQADQGEKDQPGTDDVRGKWRPSIFMPKRFAREWVEIEDVRAEQVQEITSDDAIAEGIETRLYQGSAIHTQYRDYGHPDWWLESPIESFATLWDNLHGPGAWGRNEYVWREEFRRIEP